MSILFLALTQDALIVRIKNKNNHFTAIQIDACKDQRIFLHDLWLDAGHDSFIESEQFK